MCQPLENREGSPHFSGKNLENSPLVFQHAEIRRKTPENILIFREPLCKLGAGEIITEH